MSERLMRMITQKKKQTLEKGITVIFCTMQQFCFIGISRKNNKQSKDSAMQRSIYRQLILNNKINTI